MFVYGLCGNLCNFVYLDMEWLVCLYCVIVIDWLGVGWFVCVVELLVNIYV